MKGELIQLRQSLQDLEDRAGNIETDIRNAMSEGNASYHMYVHAFSLDKFSCVQEIESRRKI